MCPGEMLVDDLAENVPNLGMMLVARDGTLLYSRFEDTFSHETLAIMSATMVGAAMTASREVGLPSLRRIVIESEMGKIFVFPTGKRNILVAVADDMSVESEKLVREALPGLGNV